jgi:Ca2+-binding RTX toxin-like protein
VGTITSTSAPTEAVFVVADNNSDTGSEVGAGNDIVIGGSTAELLIGDNSPGIGYTATGAGNDTVFGNGGDDLIFGDSSADAVTTLGPDGGNDVLNGGVGDDYLRAGPGNDDLNGGANTDDCDGEQGTDSASNCEVVAGIP